MEGGTRGRPQRGFPSVCHQRRASCLPQLVFPSDSSAQKQWLLRRAYPGGTAPPPPPPLLLLLLLQCSRFRGRGYIPRDGLTQGPEAGLHPKASQTESTLFSFCFFSSGVGWGGMGGYWSLLPTKSKGRREGLLEGRGVPA